MKMREIHTDMSDSIVETCDLNKIIKPQLFIIMILILEMYMKHLNKCTYVGYTGIYMIHV